ncbi:SIR2 family protein [Kineococcus rubinsiae]|uniref:SIR2 family protein n=1 Tax=Kineococcus rubinsiae TaxID=2609562 RepID=UPI0014317774|nr:SIR2 family protein [Kineococcus rubinsiae]
MDIPDDLIAAIAERRVIPFVGAGFSASVGLPDWSQLLRKLAEQTEGSVSFDELNELTNGDNLQMAEYLYLKSDKRIGPLRHVIERGLPAEADPIASSAHVELANLGAPQIYTTNYDDLIESTYRRLSLPVNVVALGRDVAAAGQQATQVVKYHGDLRHEETLVLTESSYFRRLDFESAMDVKFRADLLGRSVLFMGYSFRDINIRIIWFKLNQMMTDIPQADRRQSYIVRLESNPVLEELYEAVGLKTLVLDPDDAARLSDPYSRALRRSSPRIRTLGAFLGQLATRASKEFQTIPGSLNQLFVSPQLIEQGEATCDAFEGRDRVDYFGAHWRPLAMIYERVIPEQLEKRVKALAPRALRLPGLPWELVLKLILTVQASGPSTELTSVVIRRLLNIHDLPQANFNQLRRELASCQDLDWEAVWSGVVEKEEHDAILTKFASEIGFNESGHADDDIAYAAELANRLANRQLMATIDEAVVERAQLLLSRAGEMYPSILNLSSSKEAPSLDMIKVEIEERRATLPDPTDFDFEAFDPTEG